MHTLVDLLNTLLPLLYALAAANYSVYFVRQEAFAEKSCTPVLASTASLHIAFLFLRYLHFQRFPIANVAEVLSSVALAVVLVYLYVERLQRSKVTGVFLVSLAALLQVAASTVMPHMPVREGGLLTRTSLWSLHTVCAVFGYSAFAVGAVYAVMYVLLYRALKRKRFGLVFERLPPLNVLAAGGMGATVLGLAFLTGVIVLGVAMSAKLVPSFWFDPKFISVVLVWLLYALAAAAYFLFGWRGARPVVFTLVAFTIAVVSMLGSTFFWRSFHVFHA